MVLICALPINSISFNLDLILYFLQFFAQVHVNSLLFLHIYFVKVASFSRKFMGGVAIS